MSFRLVSTAILTIANESLPIDIRAYPAPKKPASAALVFNGDTVPYKRTGGKGRGLLNRSYVYFIRGEESVYFELPEALVYLVNSRAPISIVETGYDAAIENEAVAIENEAVAIENEAVAIENEAVATKKVAKAKKARK